MLQVKKRNGIIVPFDRERIVNAINKAFIEVDGELYEEETAQDIADEIKYAAAHKGEITTVEEIQDMVESYLMASERKDVARAYIRYRYKHELRRDSYNDFVKGYSEKINASNPDMQNANVDELSFGGRVGAGSDYAMKRYALEFCLSDLARRNHENNEIYVHDLSSYAIGNSNCLTLPFDELLAKGFNTRQTDVRPAGSVNTAMQLVAVLFQLQSLQQFGGVAASHLDWTMVPYVRKSFWKHYKDGMKYLEKEPDFTLSCGPEDIAIESSGYKTYPEVYQYALDMTEKECHQAAEGLLHNLNTLQSRSGELIAR